MTHDLVRTAHCHLFEAFEVGDFVVDLGSQDPDSLLLFGSSLVQRCENGTSFLVARDARW